MGYLMWHQTGGARIASTRRVLRAKELPLVQDALSLRDQLHALLDQESARQEAAACAGHAEGYEAGLAAGRAAAADELARQLLATAEASAARHATLQADIATLALQVVRKLTGQMPADVLLLQLADAAARDLIEEGPVTLVLHPADEAAVRARLDQAAHVRCASGAGNVGASAQAGGPYPPWRLPCGLAVALLSDPQCQPDTCRLETPHGSVDASVQTQLERLEAAWGGVERTSA